jgi:hypothetical protein
VGVRHRPRRRGASKVSLAEEPRTFATLVRFRWKDVVRAKPVAVPVFAEPDVLPFPRRPAPARMRQAA